MKNKIIIGSVFIALIGLFFFFNHKDEIKEQQAAQIAVVSENAKQEQLRLQAEAEQKERELKAKQIEAEKEKKAYEEQTKQEQLRLQAEAEQKERELKAKQIEAEKEKALREEAAQQELLRLQAEAAQKQREDDKAMRAREHNRTSCEQKLSDVDDKLDDKSNYEWHIIGKKTLDPRVAESLKVQLHEIDDLCPEKQSAVNSREKMINNSIKK